MSEYHIKWRLIDALVPKMSGHVNTQTDGKWDSEKVTFEEIEQIATRHEERMTAIRNAKLAREHVLQISTVAALISSSNVAAQLKSLDVHDGKSP